MLSTNLRPMRYRYDVRRDQIETPLEDLLPQLMPSGFGEGPPQPDELLSAEEANERVDGQLDDLVEAGLVVVTVEGVRLSGRGVMQLAQKLANTIVPAGGTNFHSRKSADEAVLATKPSGNARLLAAKTVRSWYQQGGERVIPLLRSHRRYRVDPPRHTVATAVLIDCSHSMILYGEDRFTPAKHMALALAGLIHRDYADDELHLIPFGSEATLVDVPTLAMQRIGPWFTNTAAGLDLARKVLRRSSAAGKHIVLITDGKPSMITLPSGNTYQNSYGIDPQIRRATLSAAKACARDGIAFTSVMIAKDRLLQEFMAEMNRVTNGTLHQLEPQQLTQVLATWQNKRSVIVS